MILDASCNEHSGFPIKDYLGVRVSIMVSGGLGHSGLLFMQAFNWGQNSN